jgi:tetratricopeptide (TPR) repeat protein
VRPSLLIAIVVALFGVLSAAEFKVESVIHPLVAKLPAPKVIAEFGKGHIAVSSSSDKAAEHVVQGISRLNTSWDFEAYRHFCEAAKLDPDCLMAYWGITISLAGSEHEFFEQRQKAVDRMLDLLEWEAEAGVEKWTKLEKGYAQAAGLLMTEGAGGAGRIFKAISKEFPNDVQSQLFSHFLLRDGFDDFGKPRVGQIKATEGLMSVLKEHPDQISVMSFWVTSQSEAPLNGAELRKDVLPIARKLVRLHPDYAPFHLMLTHVESRCGNADLAIEAAEKAVELFETYMEDEKVSFYDCESWVRAKVYLVSLYATKGKHTKAVELSKELAGIEIEKERVFSRGAGMLLWEGRTAGARIMMGRSEKDSFKEGQKILETLPEKQWFKEESLAIYYRDCLAFSLGIREAVSVKDIKAAAALYERFLERAKAFESRAPLAAKTSSYSSWLRATNVNAIVVAELRGMLAELEAGPGKLAAVNWYSAAADRQFRPSNQLPPVIDYPLELRLGNFYLSQKDFTEAAQAFSEGLELRPNHLATLRGYYQALTSLGRPKDAAALAARIKIVAQ